MTTKAAMPATTIVRFENETTQSVPGASTIELQQVFPGKILVLAAHPDDELGLCAAVLLRIPECVVVISTDGAPADEWFWRNWGSPDEYAAVRRQEASLAWAGMVHLEFLNDFATQTRFRDQELHRGLPQAFRAMRNIVDRYRPDSVIVPAYEGGHPDHDACSFLGWLLRTRLGLPVWETPLYHRSPMGALVCQQFRHTNGTELTVALTAEEIRRRAEMASIYRSQGDILPFVSTPVESYRPQADYDYSQPPHAGIVNYQAWGWALTPEEVCRSFDECRSSGLAIESEQPVS